MLPYRVGPFHPDISKGWRSLLSMTLLIPVTFEGRRIHNIGHGFFSNESTNYTQVGMSLVIEDLHFFCWCLFWPQNWYGLLGTCLLELSLYLVSDFINCFKFLATLLRWMTLTGATLRFRHHRWLLRGQHYLIFWSKKSWLAGARSSETQDCAGELAGLAGDSPSGQP